MSDQLAPKPPADLGSHEQFVELFDDFLGAVYPPSGGNRTDTGRRKLASSLVQEMERRSAVRILDCAAGTGFPSLDLKCVAPKHFKIHCCDGDSKMIAVLEVQAKKIGIDLAGIAPSRTNVGATVFQQSPLVVNWAELDELDNQYDYVLCRGNALAYADTWTGTESVASDETIYGYVERMIRRIRPGGYLHVDAPKTKELDRTISRVLGTEASSIEEEVATDAGRRRWTVEIRRGNNNPVRFVRYSSILTIGRLQEILEDLGLEETEQVPMEEERPNFGVIIARKPM